MYFQYQVRGETEIKSLNINETGTKTLKTGHDKNANFIYEFS